MRKDVKIGLAIGGVLLAVLVVYIAAIGGSGKPNTDLASNTGGDKPTAPLDVSANPDKPEPAPRAATGPAIVDPFASKPDSPAVPGDALAKASQRDLDWGKLLNGDQAMPMMTQTPTAAPTGGGAPSAAPADQKTAGPSQFEPGNTLTPFHPADPAKVGHSGDTAMSRPGDSAPPAHTGDSAITARDSRPGSHIGAGTGVSGLPSTRPAAARSHVIQKNETLSSISAAAYGSANYWAAIKRANPGIDENHLKQGATINLPDVGDVKPRDTGHAAGSAVAIVTLDSAHEYRVESGDSLHKISIKLYGKSTNADRIYELNKTLIGADPAKLKVGTVLKLPEAPTVTASRS